MESLQRPCTRSARLTLDATAALRQSHEKMAQRPWSVFLRLKPAQLGVGTMRLNLHFSLVGAKAELFEHGDEDAVLVFQMVQD